MPGDVRRPAARVRVLGRISPGALRRAAMPGAQADDRGTAALERNWADVEATLRQSPFADL